jgi:hypothetical protein
MKRNVLLLIGLLGLGISTVQSQTLQNSWENSLEGWTINEANWTSAGFSTTTGVTAGTYSWQLNAAAGPDYGLALTGPSSTGLTTSLANAASVSVDILATGFSYMQWDLEINQPGGAGTISVDGYTYNQSPSIGTESTLTFAIPSSVRQALAGHPGLPTFFTFQIGGGNPGSVYLDNLRVTPLGLINSWENSPEGWAIDEANWTSTGFSKTTGVTSGLYSWNLTAASGPDYGLPLQGPSSVDLTTTMANAASVSVDVLATGFSYMQFDLEVNQPGGAGTISVDGYTYNQSPAIGTESTLTWAIPQSVRTALLNNPSLPTYLSFQIGGGGGGTMYMDNLQEVPLPPASAQLWVRELWDDMTIDLQPALTSVGDNSSSAGFASGPWAGNPAETPTNTELMAFRTGFPNESSIQMGLPGSLDGTTGAMLQQNNGFGFFPNAGQSTFWTAGDFMTRPLNTGNFINFQAVGEYWFAMTIANATNSLDAQYVTFPSSGAGGIGFADGSTTNADFVAIGVTGLNLYIGPTNVSAPWGATNVSKAVYISQGTLGQAGNSNSTLYNPILDPSANPPDSPPNFAPPYNSEYSQTNFTGGPYHINAFGAQTVGNVAGDGIVVLGHLKTLGNGSATLDAKYYTLVGGNPWNYDLDRSPTNIQWDCSYSFNFGGTMTQMLLFQNGQFPFYMFGFRASTNFNQVVGLDPGRIQVSPLTNTFSGYPINMTNLAVEANPISFVSPPAGYGALTYQWYQNGLPISGATSQSFNIVSASTNDPSMPAGTDAGLYSSVATDPSGTWGSVTNSVFVSVTNLLPPQVSSEQLFHDGGTFQITFDEPNLTGAGNSNNYVFSGGVITTNVSVINSDTGTQVQIQTSPLPIGTRLTLTVSGVTNVVGGVLVPTNLTVWTDLQQTGAADEDLWAEIASGGDQAYFNTFLPANPHPVILSEQVLTSWEGPSSGVNINGGNGVGSDFGGRLYGWFIPPVTTNYVFFISCDDGGRLSLSTDSSPTNLFIIACESDWSAADSWTNMSDEFPSSPHRGDGTETGTNAVANYVWDNSQVSLSPATADLQNRSDQFIVAYYDSSGLPGGPAGATDQVNWATADSQVTFCVPSGTTNFWPHVDANGQALISLTAGQKYYMQLDHIQNTGGYDESVTYKFAGGPDPVSPSASILTGSNIAALVPFTPTISITETPTGPKITYTGVLLSGTNSFNITNQVGISSGGSAQYNPPHNATSVFFRTSE